MSGRDDFVSSIHLTDPWIAAITQERIAGALADFPLSMAQGWDLARVTSEIQSIANSGRGVPQQGDAAAKTELRKLTKKAKALREGIARLGQTAEIAAFWEVLRLEIESRGAKQIDYDEDYKRLLLHPLTTIENLLSRAASQIGTRSPQAPRWQQRDMMERRICFALALTPIFQECFKTSPRANNWGAEYGAEHPWAEFYRRIYCELFPETERLNLGEVLQEAARELPLVEAMKAHLYEEDATRSENSEE